MLVCFASLMHILWGVLLILNAGVVHITASATLYQAIGDGHMVNAVIYIVAGSLPLILVIRPKWNLTGLVACGPQLVLLALSGTAALAAVTSGQYADGTVRSWVFILMDQGIYMILPVLYAFETLDRFHDHSAAKPRVKNVVVTIGAP